MPTRAAARPVDPVDPIDPVDPVDPVDPDDQAPDIPPNDAGMSTAEYAIGTVAACGFAGVLWAVVHSGTVANLLQGVVERALSLGS
jgi:hypothetical protein